MRKKDAILNDMYKVIDNSPWWLFKQGKIKNVEVRLLELEREREREVGNKLFTKLRNGLKDMWIKYFKKFKKLSSKQIQTII